uniref:Zinc finger BED domain-containing protein RICESLEEPER 2 n=1 Tax=Tanacetum cinerariifolium TaxID=118510 RepID=A0A6L2LJH1_TANCI|nr:zinc finger BED domain-containing protein RICESLEEPER 2 [Tanacetum cinerariifolium]
MRRFEADRDYPLDDIVKDMEEQLEIVEALICTQDWVKKSRTQMNWDDVEDLIKEDEIVKDKEEQLEKLTGRDKAKNGGNINVSSYFVGQSLKLFYFVFGLLCNY